MTRTGHGGQVNICAMHALLCQPGKGCSLHPVHTHAQDVGVLNDALWQGGTQALYQCLVVRPTPTEINLFGISAESINRV